MRKFLVTATLIGALFGFLSVPAFAVNILGNPGFETGSLPPWFESQSCDPSVPQCEDWNVTAADNHTPGGSFSATVVTSTSTSTFGAGPRLRQNFSPVPTSSITQVSFWNKYPDATFPGADFQASLDFL